MYAPKRGPLWATNEKTTHDRNHTRKRVQKHQWPAGLNCLDWYLFYPQLPSFLQKEGREALWSYSQ